MKSCVIHKKTMHSILFSILFLFTTQANAQNIFESFARGVKAQFTGDSEIVELGNHKYEITYHSRAAANSAEKHKNWNALAKKACKGGAYNVISTRYRSATTIDQIMIGTIKCTSAGVSGDDDNSYKQLINLELLLNIQKQLSYLGYNVIVDGIMGNQTRVALADFQRKNGINSTGEPDEKTLKQLQEATANHKKVIKKDPTGADDKSATQPASIDVVSKLKELHQLKKDGAITEEEYILLKKRLLQ